MGYKHKILVACEESQTLCKAFRERGFLAYSCDMQKCSGGRPDWHINYGCLGTIEEEYFITQDGYFHPNFDGFDLMVAHPPCTYLTVTGNKWMKPEFRNRFPDRHLQREKAVQFFLDLFEAPIRHIAVENPVGIISTRFRKPDQYVHPYHFGDPHSKKTGLWLKNLPKLEPTNVVKPEMYVYKDGREDPIWHVESMKLPPDERSRVRSKTFQGMANAMADQWGNYLRAT
jgi:hypothetical protein